MAQISPEDASYSHSAPYMWSGGTMPSSADWTTALGAAEMT